MAKTITVDAVVRLTIELEEAETKPEDIMGCLDFEAYYEGQDAKVCKIELQNFNEVPNG